MKKHILIISDEPRALAELKIGLMEHFDISIAAESAAALAVCERVYVAAVLIHIGENRDNAFALFDGVSGFVKNNLIPAIFLSENDDENDEISAFAAGAADYAVRRHGAVSGLIARINLRIETHMTDDISDRNTDFAGKTVLVAEDIEINRDIVAGLLSDLHDLNIDFAADGAEAVEKFAKEPDRYSLILMDIHMPNMDGLNATKAIRSLGCANSRDIPVIALTASIMRDEIDLCLEAGMNDFIEKPKEYHKLSEMVVEYLHLSEEESLKHEK